MDKTAIKPNPTRGPACFAPPLDDAKIEQYQRLADGISAGPICDAFCSLLEMVVKFRETPESKLPGVPLQTEYTRSPFKGKAPPKIVPLEQAEVERIWDYVPWPHELNAIGQLFDTIPNESQKELRDAAFHLLWFGRELCLDREPMTNDKI